MAITDRYYVALGRFVQTFATVESTIFMALCLVSGTDLKAFQAMLSGTRTNTACGFMRRLYEALEKTLPHQLDEALSQLATINTDRDLILHSGVVECGDGLLRASNAIRAHAPRAHRALPVSVSALRQMTADLKTISARLELEMFDAAAKQELPSVRFRITRDQLLRLSRKPLLYKAAQPSTKGRKPQ